MERRKVMHSQIEPGHYLDHAYDVKERFISYWHQINEILLFKENTILEVGVGNGFVSHYLKRRGIRLHTMDIDSRLQPDSVGSILDMPHGDGAFDVAACFEVLEHLPYDKVKQALSELHRVARRCVIVSLPDTNRTIQFYLHIPNILLIRQLIPVPRFKKRIHGPGGEHYWEIGKAGYPLSRIRRDMHESGFVIERTYRVFEYPYHRFFRLMKNT